MILEITGGGTRQFEIYNNVFDRVSNSVAINKWIWVRGSSGVIANNSFDRAESPDGQTYPNKSEILLTVGCPTRIRCSTKWVNRTRAQRTRPRVHYSFSATRVRAPRMETSSLLPAATRGPSCSTPTTISSPGSDTV